MGTFLLSLLMGMGPESVKFILGGPLMGRDMGPESVKFILGVPLWEGIWDPNL